MNLRPFWQKHPLLLRVTAGLMLLATPLLLPCLVVMAAWDDRDSIARLYRELFNYVVKG